MARGRSHRLYTHPRAGSSAQVEQASENSPSSILTSFLHSGKCLFQITRTKCLITQTSLSDPKYLNIQIKQAPSKRAIVAYVLVSSRYPLTTQNPDVETEYYKKK
jgi:hypothetical protein